MNVRQLEVLRTMIRTGSVSETARLLGISQPAISKTLSAVEQDLGMVLFQRAKGRLQTTREAQELFPEIERIFGDMATFHQRAGEIRDGKAGKIRVAAVPVLAALLLPPALTRFAATHPKVRFDARAASSAETVELVNSNRADLALVQALADETTAIAAPLCRGRVICLMAASHPLAAQAAIGPGDLVGQRVVTFDQYTPTGRRVREAFRSAGHVLETAVDINQSFLAAAMVRGGVGVALVDSLFPVADYLPDLLVRPLEPEIPLTVNVVIARDRTLSPAARAFVETLREVARELPGRQPWVLPA
ncbi:MAG: LysR family transcriptional regulator [Alphaproteobacteria bacterium]|nr:LysR family transcriptional regulator [Alphaproteobacteria bacterium]